MRAARRRIGDAVKTERQEDPSAWTRARVIVHKLSRVFLLRDREVEVENEGEEEEGGEWNRRMKEFPCWARNRQTVSDRFQAQQIETLKKTPYYLKTR